MQVRELIKLLGDFDPSDEVLVPVGMDLSSIRSVRKTRVLQHVTGPEHDLDYWYPTDLPIRFKEQKEKVVVIIDSTPLDELIHK